MTIAGSQVPAGNEILWYIGGAEVTLVQEDIAVSSEKITLTNKAEFGSVVVVDSDGAMANEMLELSAIDPSDVVATEATGTLFVDVGSTTGTVTAYYIDIATTALEQIMACKDVSTNLSIDTIETAVHGQTQKLQKTGAATRTASLEEVTYDRALIGAVFGDVIADSPVAGDSKWTDNFTSVKKISALVGKQYQSGVLIKKWYLMGCQVSKIDDSFPTSDFYTDSLDFLVDYLTVTTLVPN